MITVDRLHYRYPPLLPSDTDWQTVLDEVSFHAPVGTCLALTGANNSGKTTLCLALAGLAPRLTAGQVSGTIHVAGRDVQSEPPGACADAVGLVMQDPVGQLFNPTIEAEIAWGLENLGLPPTQIRQRIDWALDLVGLTGIPRSRAPQTLSGGEAKRLTLAAALALRPDVLILDEPTGGLSPAARQGMITVLRDLREAQSLTILLAENNAEAIAELADEVLVLSAGSIIRRSSPHRLYPALADAPLAGLALPPGAEFAAAASSLGGVELTSITTAQAIEQARAFPLTAPQPPTGSVAPPSPADAAPLLQIHDLSFSYPDGPVILHNISLDLYPGTFTTLLGDNGAGKTTLARHFVGLLRPDVGHVCLAGQNTADWSIGRMAQHVGFAFQNPEQQIFSSTIREEVAFGPRNLDFNQADQRQAVEEALARFALTSLADAPPAALSFSQRRLVALAGIAAMRTPIIVLDEPTIGLDADGAARVTDWLNQRRAEGAAVLLITHNVELAARHADRVLIMEDGRITVEGAPRDVFQRVDLLVGAGLRAPFAVEFARALGRPALAADLTPQGAARAWLEALA